MKKLTALVLLVITVLTSPAYAMAAATLSLSPATGTFNPGCNVKLNVMINTGGAATDGVDAILFYDPTRMVAKKINNGTIYAEYPGNIIDTEASRIVISGSASQTAPFTGSGILATIDFTVSESAPSGTTQIKFEFDPADKTKTTDSNVAEKNNVSDILGSVVDGNYTIGTGTSCAQGAAGDTTPAVATPSPIPLKTLPVAADINTTLIVAIGGGLLTVLGLLGLAFL